MSPDLRTLVPALVATLAAACSSNSSSDDFARCSPESPRETRTEVAMDASFCAVPTQSPAPGPSAAAPEAGAPNVVAADGAASAAVEAPAPPAPPPVKAAEDIVPSDPKTCELDCYRFCSGMCRRLSEEKVECIQFEGGHPCGRVIEGAFAPKAAASNDEALLAMFALESISAIAFERLALELRGFGAPAALVKGAEDNAADERRHALLVRAMLEAEGIGCDDPVVELRDDRNLFEVASENAVEGCVRETFGALAAEYGRVRGGALRGFYEAIAEDELRHAQWSWELHAWAKAALGREQAATLDALTRRAYEDLTANTPSLPGIDPSFDAVKSVAITAFGDRLGIAA